MDIPHWDFVGSTMVASSYVRLTPDRQSKQGALWNTMVKCNCYSNSCRLSHSQFKCTTGRYWYNSQSMELAKIYLVTALPSGILRNAVN